MSEFERELILQLRIIATVLGVIAGILFAAATRRRGHE